MVYKTKGWNALEDVMFGTPFYDVKWIGKGSTLVGVSDYLSVNNVFMKNFLLFAFQLLVGGEAVTYFMNSSTSSTERAFHWLLIFVFSKITSLPLCFIYTKRKVGHLCFFPLGRRKVE